MERSRTRTPVVVHHFPKRQVSRAAVTQTIPEVRPPEATAAGVTPSGERRRRRTRSGDKAPVDFSELMQLGHDLFEAGRVSEARVIFEGLVAAGHADAFCYTMLGTISLALKDFDRALELFDEAVSRDAGDLAALVYRAELRLKRKKSAAAVKDLEAALALGAPDDPFVARAWRLLAMARRRPVGGR